MSAPSPPARSAADRGLNPGQRRGWAARRGIWGPERPPQPVLATPSAPERGFRCRCVRPEASFGRLRADHELHGRSYRAGRLRPKRMGARRAVKPARCATVGGFPSRLFRLGSPRFPHGWGASVCSEKTLARSQALQGLCHARALQGLDLTAPPGRGTPPTPPAPRVVRVPGLRGRPVHGAPRRHGRSRGPSAAPPRCLHAAAAKLQMLRTRRPPACRNVLLFQPHEWSGRPARVALPGTDSRAQHVRDVLRAAPVSTAAAPGMVVVVEG